MSFGDFSREYEYMAQVVHAATFEDRRFAVQESFDAASNQHLAPAAVQFNTLGGHLVTAPTTAGPPVHRPALIFVHGSPRIGGSAFALWIHSHPDQPAHARNGGINSIVGASVWNEAASTIASNPENTNLIEPVPEPHAHQCQPLFALYTLERARCRL